MTQPGGHDQPASQEQIQNSIQRFLGALREDYAATVEDEGRYTSEDIRIAQGRIEEMYLENYYAREEILRQAGDMLFKGEIDSDLFEIISQQPAQNKQGEKIEKMQSFDSGPAYTQALVSVLEPLIQSGAPIPEQLMQSARSRFVNMPKYERDQLKKAFGTQAYLGKIDDRYLLVSFGEKELNNFKNVKLLTAILHTELKAYDTHNLIELYRELATWFASGAPKALDQDSAQDILFTSQPALKKIYDETQDKLAKARAAKKKSADIKKELEELEKKLGLLDGESAKNLATSFMLFASRKLHRQLVDMIAYKDSLEEVELQQSVIMESLHNTSLQTELDRLPTLEELSDDIKGLESEIEDVWGKRGEQTEATVTDYVSALLRKWDEGQDLYGQITEVRQAQRKANERPYAPSHAQKTLETVYGIEAKKNAETAQLKEEQGDKKQAAAFERSVPKYETLQLLYSAAGVARDTSNELLAESRESGISEAQAKSLRNESVAELERAKKYESLVNVYMNLLNIEERYHQPYTPKNLGAYVQKVIDELQKTNGIKFIYNKEAGKEIEDDIAAIKSAIDSVINEAEDYRASRHSS